MLGYHTPPPPRAGTSPPPQRTATVADGTHPTGMHSCLIAVLQSINTELESLSAMDVLADDSIVVSGRGSIKWPSVRPDTRSKFIKYNRVTGKSLCNIYSTHACMPDGMAVLTTADGYERIAFSYRYCISDI